MVTFFTYSLLFKEVGLPCMRYRKLGKSTLLISEIGMGCMSLDPSSDLNSILINKAIDSGINFFDTADLYEKGHNEIILGNALKGKREKVIVATKVGNQWKSDGTSWEWNPSKKHIFEAVEKSLQRLKTNYIDLYQLHGGTIHDNFDDIIETFERLKESGKIRYYGISSIRPNVIKKAAYKFTSLMLQYSLLDRRPEEEILDFMAAKEVGILARGTLAKGMLLNKSPENYLEYSSSNIKELQGLLKNYHEKSSDVAIALGFVLANRAVTSSIVGIRTLSQLDSLIKAVPLLPINEKTLTDLKDKFPRHIYKDHRK